MHSPSMPACFTPKSPALRAGEEQLPCKQMEAAGGSTESKTILPGNARIINLLPGL